MDPREGGKIYGRQSAWLRGGDDRKTLMGETERSWLSLSQPDPRETASPVGRGDWHERASMVASHLAQSPGCAPQVMDFLEMALTKI